MKNKLTIVLAAIAVCISLFFLVALILSSDVSIAIADETPLDRCSLPSGFSCEDLFVNEAQNTISFGVINQFNETFQNVSITLQHLDASFGCTRIMPEQEVVFESNKRLDVEFGCGSMREGEQFQKQVVIRYARGEETFVDHGIIRATPY